MKPKTAAASTNSFLAVFGNQYFPVEKARIDTTVPPGPACVMIRIRDTLLGCYVDRLILDCDTYPIDSDSSFAFELTRKIRPQQLYCYKTHEIWGVISLLATQAS